MSEVSNLVIGRGVLALLLATACGGFGQSYDFPDGFSPTSNPAGVWSYGAKRSLDSALSLFAIRGEVPADGGVPTQYWQLVRSQEPTIFRNGSTMTITIGGGVGTMPPGTAWLYSGTDGSPNVFGVIRFTVPTTGDYSIEGSARPVYDTTIQGDTDYHVVRNGAELFGQFLANQQSANYSNTLALVAGDAIDFMVGRGADGSGFGAGLKVAAHLRLLPPNQPPTARDQAVAVQGDKTVAITLEASDPDGDVLTYAVTAPGHGTLSGTAPNLIYQPSAGYVGPDNFTFKVNDGRAESGVATVSIQVLSPNRAPIARVVLEPLLTLFPGEELKSVLAANQHSAVITLDGSQSSDPDNDPITYAWTEGTEPLLSGTGVVVTNMFELGEHHVTLTVNDGVAAGSETVTFAVITPGEAVELIIVALEESSLDRRQKRPLVATLKAATAALDRGQIHTGTILLGAFQNKVQAQVQPSHPGLAAALSGAAQELIEALAADQAP